MFSFRITNNCNTIQKNQIKEHLPKAHFLQSYNWTIWNTCDKHNVEIIASILKCPEFMFANFVYSRIIANRRISIIRVQSNFECSKIEGREERDNSRYFENRLFANNRNSTIRDYSRILKFREYSLQFFFGFQTFRLITGNCLFWV